MRDKNFLQSCLVVGCAGILAITMGIIIIVAAFFNGVFGGGLGANRVPVVPVGDGTYIFPVGAPIIVNSHFSLSRTIPSLGIYDQPHYGTDFNGGEGDGVVCPRDGVVKETYRSTVGGITLVIDHGGGHETRYLHLSGYTVSVGDNVTQGQSIALIGNTGTASTGAHLHFEVRIDGVPIDSLQVLPPLP